MPEYEFVIIRDGVDLFRTDSIDSIKYADATLSVDNGYHITDYKTVPGFEYVCRKVLK